MKTKLKRGILLSLAACDGAPMPEVALFAAAGLYVRPACPTDGDTRDALRDLESLGLVEGITDQVLESRTWTLTTRGQHEARRLR